MNFDLCSRYTMTELTSIPVKYLSLLTLRKSHTSPLEHKTFKHFLLNENRNLKIKFESYNSKFY